MVKRMHVTTVGVVVVLVVGTAVGFLLNNSKKNWPAFKVDESEQPKASDSEKYVTQPPAKKALAPEKVLSLKQHAIEELKSEKKDRWRTIFATTFKSLSTADMWDVLTSEGVSNQNESKAAREQLLHACGHFIVNPNVQVVGVTGGSSTVLQQPVDPNAPPTLLSTQCKDLGTRGDREYFISQAQALRDDLDFQSAPFRVMPITVDDWKHLTDQERSTLQSVADARLGQSDDVYSVAAGVSDLWDIRSPELLSDWSGLNNFTEDQQDQMKLALSLDQTCRIIGGCAPNSPWTFEFCHMRQVQCLPNMSFDDAVAYNMTPAQQDFYQKLAANLSNFTK